MTIRLDRDGDEPAPTGAVPRTGARLAVAMPHDVENLRALTPGTARRRREAVRKAVLTAVGTGHVIVDVTRDGWYVLGDET